MASSVALTTTWFFDGPTYDGQICRQDVAAMAYDAGASGSVVPLGGVLQGGERMGVNAATGMQVTVNGGACIVPSGVSALQGAYRAILMQPATLTVGTSDASNPRVDAVAVYVDDLGTSSSQTFVEVFPGTPTAGANLTNLNGAPSLPNSSLLLAYILVPAGSTSVTSGHIQDQRVVTVAPGGVLPCASVLAVPAGTAPGQLAYDAVNDRFFHLAPGGPEQARTLPFAPQYDTNSATVGGVSTQQTICSVSITCDGETDLEIVATWPAVHINAAQSYIGQYGAFLGIYIDSTEVRSVQAAASSVSGGGTAGMGFGGSFTHFTQSGVDRPSSGPHTVIFVMVPNGDGTHQVQVGAASEESSLYVRPVPQ